jgi:hypothetical protein
VSGRFCVGVGVGVGVGRCIVFGCWDGTLIVSNLCPLSSVVGSLVL